MQDTIAVNLGTAEPSRYERYAFNGFFELNGKVYGTNALGIFRLDGDLDYGSEPVNARVTTAPVDFGAKELKRCADAYLHARTDGALDLALTVDEAEIATELPFNAPFQADNGARQFKAKLPRGAKGTNWQFEISNVDGCRFDLFGLKVVPVASSRTI